MLYLRLNKGFVMKRITLSFIFFMGLIGSIYGETKFKKYGDNIILISNNKLIGKNFKIDQTLIPQTDAKSKKQALDATISTNSVNNKTINSIILSVDKEPITSYELDQTMKSLHVPKEQALEILINEKIENSQLRQLGIFVNDLEVEQALEKITKQNQMSIQDFKKTLKEKGQNYEEFYQNLKDDLQKRKLYERVATFAKIDYSEDGARKYFEHNKEKFTFYTSIDVYIYKANNEQILEQIKAQMNTNLKPSVVTLNIRNTDPRLLGLLSRIGIGNFSPVLNTQNGFELYKIRNKSGGQNPDFNQVKQEVVNFYINEQRSNFVQDYFDKLRSKAQIEYL